MATLYAKTAGGNWTSANTWSNVNAGGADNSGPPLAGDNVIFELLSGAVTVDTGAVARSLDCTSGTGSYTGTLTHTAAVVLTLGDGTAGAGSVALKFSSGMTYTLGATTAQITFASTSVTQQTITTAGKTLGTIVYNGVAQSLLLTEAMATGNTTNSVTNGIINTAGFALTTGAVSAAAGGTITLGASTVTLNRTAAGSIWSMAGGTTVSAASSTIIINAASANSRTFVGQGKTYGTLTYTVAGSTGALVFNQGSTFGTITFSDATNARTMTLPISTTQTITTALNITGTVGKLMTLQSSSAGTPATISKASGVVVLDYCNIIDITFTGGATFLATHSTNGGGNTGITFVTSTPGGLLLMGVGN